MRSSVLTRVLASGAIVAAAPVAASPAAAAPAAGQFTGRPLAKLTRYRDSSLVSGNWSGYIVTGSTYTSVASSWTQPTVTCPAPNAAVSFWVGLDGVTSNSNTVEQTGTMVSCSNGNPSYHGWWETYPANAQTNYANVVKPGDSLSASVTHAGSNRFTLVLKDATQNWSHTTSATIRGAVRSSAEVITEAPSTIGGQVPLADFATIPFSASAVNGASLTGSTAGIQAVEMTTNGQSTGTVMAAPTAISAGAFNDVWSHQ